MDTDKEFVHLARLSLSGSRNDIAAMVRKVLPGLVERRPDLAKPASALLRLAASEANPARSVPISPLPVDSDSRLELLRRELIELIDPEPEWPSEVQEALNAVLQEREREQELATVGLDPTKSLLFVGAPGVGKTLAARWLAKELSRPLLTLDLAAVMSSFLGRTGNNIRAVLDYARRSPSVLLLDEFDAIAKRRDDSTEVGELKRLVTVLLQSVDDWPANGLLIAATNHSELLDPAVWRRFDLVIQFPMPGQSEIRSVIASLAGEALGEELIAIMACVLEGRSFAEITRELNQTRRRAFLRGQPFTDSLLARAAEISQGADQDIRLAIATGLARLGKSLRSISEITGLSRDTMRTHGVGGANDDRKKRP
jgi:MoxR-like ATPase